MKTRLLGLAVAGCFCFLPGALVAQMSPPPPPPFLEALSVHGAWRHETGYGWYWRPYEAERVAGWRPYLQGGHWQWTGDAWSWASDSTWGATVFHFGRWANVPSRGWIWIPGEEFAPAWVQWVRLDSYWGWAPLPPEPGFAPGYALSIPLQAEDYMMVPEGAMASRNLESVAFAGLNPAAASQAYASGAPAPVQVVPQAPQTVVIYQEPPVYLPQTTFSLGMYGWWNDGYRSGYRYGSPHGYPSGHCYGRPQGRHARPSAPPHRQRPSASVRSTPAHRHAPSRVTAPPPRASAPTRRPAVSSQPSRRAEGLQSFLNRRR